MESEWKEVAFNDLGEVNRGRSRHRPRYAEHLYGGPYPFIQTGDIRESNGRIVKHTQTYSDEGLKQSRIWPAGTMCITIAANIAETALLTYPACFPDSVVGFVADDNICDVRFIEYNFRLLKRRLQSEACGSVQDNINLATLSRLAISLPPLPEQHAIANILGSLDDKIELNRRMNETLEGMAQALFKSWFVDFDPVIDNAIVAGNPIPEELADRADVRRAALANGTANREAAKQFPAGFQRTEELGWIPVGWEVGLLSDFGNIVTGKTPPKATNDAFGDGCIFLTPTDYDGNILTIETARRLSENGEKSIANTRLAKGSVCVTCIGSQMGRTTLIAEDGFTNQQINSISPRNEMHRYYVLMNLRYRRDEIFAIGSSGSTMPIVNKGLFSRLPLLKPDEFTLENYDQEASHIFDRLTIANHQNKSLTKLRDTLIPKLISGELRIPDAEKLAEAALA